MDALRTRKASALFHHGRRKACSSITGEPPDPGEEIQEGAEACRKGEAANESGGDARNRRLAATSLDTPSVPASWRDLLPSLWGQGRPKGGLLEFFLSRTVGRTHQPLTRLSVFSYVLDMHSSLHRPLVLGHRGYRARFPENTLLAFREALTAGADGIECDLQKSADGRYVIIHDPSTDRVTGSGLEVGSSSSVDLRALDAGRGERLPFMEEMLSALPQDAYLDLELKEETLVPEDAERIAGILDARMPRERLM